MTDEEFIVMEVSTYYYRAKQMRSEFIASLVRKALKFFREKCCASKYFAYLRTSYQENWEDYKETLNHNHGSLINSEFEEKNCKV